MMLVLDGAYLVGDWSSESAAVALLEKGADPNVADKVKTSVLA
jgi:hypothetical protein